jgi:hypothetical protein
VIHTELSISRIDKPKKFFTHEIFLAFVDITVFVDDVFHQHLSKKVFSSMEQTKPTLLTKLTENKERFAVACETLNTQMEELTGESLEMDTTTCGMVFEALYHAVESVFHSFCDPWPEVTLKYIAMYDGGDYSPVTGIRINKVREQFVVKLSTKMGWDYYHRNWKRLMCCAAQLLLITRDMSNQEVERAIAETILTRNRTSDRRTAVQPEELSA